MVYFFRQLSVIDLGSEALASPALGKTKVSLPDSQSTILS